MKMNNLIIIRGGGDLATGAIQKLHRAGFPVFVLETDQPMAIRRYVALSEAVYEGRWTVEDITAVLVNDLDQAMIEIEQGNVPVLVDPTCDILQHMKPMALVDAILAKRNLGTSRNMASITVALGPGFSAGLDVDIVVETMRGHDLGRLIFSGSALPNTGTPGLIAGEGTTRVVHAQTAGIIRPMKSIGDRVAKGEIIAMIGGEPIRATLNGILRGLIREGFPVTAGLKIADIDPRLDEQQNCFTISDKARCIGGSVLEAVMLLGNGSMTC